MKYFFILLFSSFLFISMKSDKPAYKIFDQKGKESSYKEMLEDAQKADIILFGELHDVSVCHWLEYELASDLFKAKGKNLVMGAEMFEADNQVIINEYLKGLIKDKNFEAEARLWPNYKTDYKKLLVFARDSSVNFIATNIPRRYASMVNKGGFEVLGTLSPQAQQFFPPLPIAYDPELNCYKEILKEMGQTPSHDNENIAKAQAVKDAAMAYFILKKFKKGQVFLHYNGSYHSDHFEGIAWYLKQADPSLKIMTIATSTQDDISEPLAEEIGKGNYLILIPEGMNRTY